jgi:hypothetical protein
MTEAQNIEVVKVYGNARPDDLHLAADIVAVDGGILDVLRARISTRPKRDLQNPCNSNPRPKTASIAESVAGATNERARSFSSNHAKTGVNKQ